MNLGTHGMVVQGYLALHNGTYQNPELLMLDGGQYCSGAKTKMEPRY